MKEAAAHSHFHVSQRAPGSTRRVRHCPGHEKGFGYLSLSTPNAFRGSLIQLPATQRTRASPSPPSQLRGLHAPHLAGARAHELTRSPSRSRSESAETKASPFWHAFRPGRWMAICLSLGIITSTPGMLFNCCSYHGFFMGLFDFGQTLAPKSSRHLLSSPALRPTPCLQLKPPI